MAAVVVLIGLCAVAQAQIAMHSDRLDAAIDPQTGVLVSLTDRASGLQLLRPSPCRYVLQPDPNSEVEATELEDRVTGQEGDRLVCRNPKLPGVRIEKQYVLDGRLLTKRIRFSAEARDIGLLKYSVGSSVTPEFYAGGYLNDPTRHPVDYPYIFTRDLDAERHIRDYHNVADHHLVIFTNPERGIGLAQYRLSVDGRFVHPLTSYSYDPGLYYGPDGWRLAVAARWMSDDRPALECESRWHLFDGDHVAFHQEYLRLPEFAEQWDWQSPEWVRDVVGVASWQWTSSSPNVQGYLQRVESLGEGYLMVTLGGIFHNTRDYLSDPIQTPSGVPLPAAELRRIVDDLHALSPRIKVGPVTWQWGFGDLDPVFREHPEWTVHDGAGEPMFAASGWSGERVFSQLLTPECRQYVVSQYQGACKRYDFDFIYMDTGQGGVTRFDWNTHWGAQDYDWADLYRGIRDATRGNRDGAAFFNGTPRLYSSYCDCGYFEGVGFIKTHDWRALADRLFLVKLYQPGEKWTMPLYWRDDNLEEYAAYCLALALKPVGFMGPGPAATRWPAIAAANELRQARLAPDADARPCWWKQQTDIEAYALRLPGGGLLTALSHAAEPAEAELSCLIEPLGLDPARPVHLWLFRQRSVAEMQQTVKITGAQADAYYAQTGRAPCRGVTAEYLGTEAFADGTARVKTELQPGFAAVVLLTQAPELALEVNGRPAHLLLPAGEGATKTVAADRPLAPEVLASREDVQLPAEMYSPMIVTAHSSPEVMNHTETEVGRQVAGLHVLRLLTNDCEHNTEDTASASIAEGGGAISLVTDMGREKVSGYAYAGFEADNPGALKLRVDL
ncbi:MAG TPA: hypothetical protein VM283_01605, partial [Armatimonadota bacterium]|nr:hypothetical protein [Armatimonadota bacterium]